MVNHQKRQFERRINYAIDWISNDALTRDAILYVQPPLSPATPEVPVFSTESRENCDASIASVTDNMCSEDYKQIDNDPTTVKNHLYISIQ